MTPIRIPIHITLSWAVIPTKICAIIFSLHNYMLWYIMK